MKKIKKFGKFKKRKTRIRKPSDSNYTYTPAHNGASPAPGLSVPIVQMKLESVSDDQLLEIEKDIRVYLADIIDSEFTIDVDFYNTKFDIEFDIEFSVLIRRPRNFVAPEWSGIKDDVSRMISIMELEVTQVDTDFASLSSIDEISDYNTSRVVEIHFIKKVN